MASSSRIAPFIKENDFEWELYISREENSDPDLEGPENNGPISRSQSQSPPLSLEELSTPQRGGNHSIGARIQAITLMQAGMKVDFVTEFTGIKKTRVYELVKQAKQRGYNPTISKVVEVYHVIEAPRSGRPQVSQVVKDEVLKLLTKNSTTRGISCSQIV